MLCQQPKFFGSPRHLHPCSATYRIAFNTWRLSKWTLPLWRGKQSAILSYCSRVICIRHSYGILALCQIALTGPKGTARAAFCYEAEAQFICAVASPVSKPSSFTDEDSRAKRRSKRVFSFGMPSISKLICSSCYAAHVPARCPSQNTPAELTLCRGVAVYSARVLSRASCPESDR